MARKSAKRTNSRLRRDDPDRVAPNRSGADHILRNARRNDDNASSARRKPSLISEGAQQAISDMVQLSSNVIEEQIRAGQTAANRLREGIAGSQKLDTDINSMVESLVATTRDVGATWLDLVSLVLRSIGTQQPDNGKPGGNPTSPVPGSQTVTETGASAGAVTVSSITPFDPTIAGVPPAIVVGGGQVTNVALDLRPSSASFVPAVRVLLGSDARPGGVTAKFTLNRRSTSLVLTITAEEGVPAGTYSGAVVDNGTNASGGTLSVTVSG